jgi:hypothetical protein
VALLAGLLTGCGIPDGSEVVTVKPGPSTGLTAGGDDTPTRNTRESTNDRARFIANYLEAVAGDPATAPVDRVKEFFSPAARRTLKLNPEVRVVRLVEKPLVNPGSSTVSVKVQPVGVLAGTKGTLEAPASLRTIPYNFTVEEVEGQTGLFITKAPPVLLLSDTALSTFYERRTIYFWNRENTALVPDVRYMSSSIPSERRPTEIVKWLAAGPSQWLAGVVQGLPENTKVDSNVPAVTDEKLQINLSGVAVPPDDPGFLNRLAHQLRWSLRPYLAPQLELRFDNQVQNVYSGTEYLSSNPAYRFAEEPERFCVYDGQIRRLARSVNPTLPVPGVTADVNRNVRSAALSSVGGTHTYAAVVAVEGTRQVLRVGTSVAGRPAVFRRSALPGAAGRPVWAVLPQGPDTGAAVGLIVVGGKIYGFGVGGDIPRPVEWQGGPTGVQAVAVAPDGRRVAVVAGGQLYMSILTSAGNSMQLAAPRLIPVLLRDLSAVDWSSEGFVLVAGVSGESGRVAITDVSIDGAVQTNRQADLGTAVITHLVAFPANPVVPDGDAKTVSYVADGVAYDVLGEPKRIAVTDIAGPVPSPAAGVLPAAPFFLN